MAGSMENGPSNYNGEAEPVWERPWTLDEMRKTSSSWSLAADSGLFLYLQDFSQRMLSKTHEIEKQLDGLIRDTKATDSCLHTVFNDFLMLSNTQFIENRVYDEEVEEAAPKTEAQEKRPEQEKTREQKEAELIPKVQEAVNYGLKVLESAFEQLDIKAGNSDSEDEEAADRVEPILEPKDLYVDRPLPYLIGSQAFMEQDDVGLGDLSSDEMSIDSDRESVIESEEGKDEEQSDEDFDQEEEGQGSLKKKTSVVSYEDEEDEDEDSDIFGESDKDEDEARKDDVGPTSFTDELAARIKGDTPSKPEADRTSLSSGPSVSKKKNKGKKLPKASVEDDNDEMFKPPKMEDDEYSPFGGKGGLFSGGKGLFDDDDEGDLFSEAPKNEPMEQPVPQTESAKTRKIPTGAVSIFPEYSRFGSPNTSDSLESKENGSPVKPKVQATPKQAAVGGGLFDDNDDDDDDFFSGKALKKPASDGQEKPKPKKTVDLFGGDEDDDDEGDIFNARNVTTSQQAKKTVEEEAVVRPPEKKLPAGAISMFGPGTKNLLVEGLKKRQPSTSEESEKSEENVPPPEVKAPVAPKTAEKVQNKSLFSDDEDSQIFSPMPKSQSKHEAPTQSKPSKTPLSIFDDEEEEDLFSSVPKSKSVQVKTAALQPKKTVSSALFSDDEDQWMNSQPSTVKPEVKSGGMKASASAPSRLPSAKAPQRDSLFDVDDGDDLFAATKESSQKKPQRVSLLFEDEDDEDKALLFGSKPPENKTTPEVKVPAATSQAASLFGPEDSEEASSVTPPVNDKVADEKSLDKKPVQTTPSPEESSVTKKKPAGAVSLFGGINVLGDGPEPTKKQTKSPLDDLDDLDWHKETPPPIESKVKKAKKTTLSLFDDDDDDIDDEEEADETSPVSVATKTADRSTFKSQEQKPLVKSTGVFQDEELLFSHTQQRDNDPDVDLFANTAKSSAPLSSSVKPAAPTLFGDDDDDDDLFSSAKPKAPPKIPQKPSKPKKDEIDKSTAHSTQNEKPASPVKSKETSSRIGKLQANLGINPASLLPGAGPRVPGAVSVIPGLAPSPSARAAGPLPGSVGRPELQTPTEGGVSFDTPAQVTTLQSANKDRAKGATRRRPQTRAARQLSAQRSEEARGDIQEENSIPPAASGVGTAFSVPPFNPVLARPSALTLPVTTSPTAPTHRQSDESVRPKMPPAASLAAEEDLFASKDLFASTSVPKHTPSPQPKTKPLETVPDGASRRDATVASKKDPTLSIFEDHGEDLFATVKPKPVRKAKGVPFLDDDDDNDDDDIFRTEKRKGSKMPSDLTKPDIFQDKNETPSKTPKKPKEASLDVSLFDDDVDIFADLTPTTKPKGKKVKKKVETKSIFDDDMDDIFSSGSKPVAAPTSKPKRPTQEPSSAEESGHSIFDDPLNVFGGN